MNNQPNQLSKSQEKLFNELCADRVIVEDRYNGKLSYSTANITAIPHAYHLPRRANKQTVWALLSFGLIEITTIWEDSPYPPKEVYVLSDFGQSLRALRNTPDDIVHTNRDGGQG